MGTNCVLLVADLFLYSLAYCAFVLQLIRHARPHMGQEMLTLSGTHDFTPLGEFMISPIHYIYITEFVSLMTMFTD